MHELCTLYLERSTTSASMVPQENRLGPAPDRRSHGRQRGGRQSVDAARPRRGTRNPTPSPPPWSFPPLVTPTAGASARPLGSGRRRVWLPRAGLDPRPDRGGPSPGVWHLLPSRPCRPLAQSATLEPAKARAAGTPARRSRHCPLARAYLARHQQGAQAQQQSIFFIDESGFYPLPSVVRTYAPVGHTPILREWWTRDHLSAISAMSPEGKLYFHCQDCAINSEDVVAFLEHLLREVPGYRAAWSSSGMARRFTAVT